ncbi:MAG: MFS transporter [Ignavibacteria bacterium]|nr:MFS transporter [Ignavibacteria bacterium]
MKIEKYNSLEERQLERKTFRLHLISQLFNGISLGILLLQDVILKKSLEASNFEVTVLIFMTSIAFLFSIYGAEIINRSSRPGLTAFLIGSTGKLFLFLIPLFNTSFIFIFSIAVMSIIDSLLLPTWNIVYKHNYTADKRSSLYSYASSLSTAALLTMTTVFGYFLDFNHDIYKIFFPVAGVLGILMYFNLMKMLNFSFEFEKEIVKRNFRMDLTLIKDILVLPIRNSIRILKTNRRFLVFEINFFIYGMAFMISSPAIPVFLVDGLHLAYTPISFAKGLIFHTALIIFTPISGKFLGINNPTKFSGYMFLILFFFPFTLLAAKYFPLWGIYNSPVEILFFSFFLFGTAMSGVTIAWNLSSIYYAPHNEVSNYQAVHVTLTGVRGLFSPILGYIIMQVFSIEAAMILASILFAVAGILMLLESKRS